MRALGQLIVESVVKEHLRCELNAIGTNNIATSEMFKAGSENGDTGESPVIVICRDADVIN